MRYVTLVHTHKVTYGLSTATDIYDFQKVSMTLNGVMAFILCYFTEFGNHRSQFRHRLQENCTTENLVSENM